ncbi:MAG: hypothetical protein ABJA18_10925 [bacterium]
MRREKRKGEVTHGWAAHSRFVGLLGLAIVMLLIGAGSGYGQDRAAGQNGVVYGQTSGQKGIVDQDMGRGHDGALDQCSEPARGSYKFRWQGESFEIPINGDDCQAVALELRWSNGRNNGSNFQVTFLDNDNQSIYTKELSGFLTGNFRFDLAAMEPQPWPGSRSMTSVVSVPARVVIQTVRPFAFPANLSYTITRAAGQRPQQKPIVKSESEAVNKGKVQRLKEESADSTSGKARKP